MHTTSSTTTLKVVIPRGLPLLLHQVSKAVIKDQPTNIYSFLAEYFEGLLQVQAGDAITVAEIIEKNPGIHYSL
jgi:hypothetical protein